MIGKIQLDKLIDINILQDIQNSFSRTTKISAVTVNYDGKPITEPSNFTEFCNIIRGDEKLKGKCYQCDAYGGIQAAINRKPYVYKCHMGLFDFAIPVMIEENYVGAILCGQVKVENEDNENIGSFGKMSKWDNDDLKSLYEKIPVKTYEDIESAANLIHQISKYMVESEFINLIKEELNSKTTKLMEEENKRIKLEKSLKEAELKSLHYQINPHFMFNTLNTILNLAYMEGASKTEEFVYNFSDIIKYTLRKDNSHSVYLEDEVNYVKNYFKIQKTRFGEKMNYSIDIDEKLYQLECPFMLLQPLVENFIKYVVQKKIDGGNIKIKGYREYNNYIIDVSDDGDGLSKNKIDSILNGIEYEKKEKCIGIHNINKRLIYLFGEEYALRIYSDNAKGKGILVRITLPIEREVMYV